MFTFKEVVLERMYMGPITFFYLCIHDYNLQAASQKMFSKNKTC